MQVADWARMAFFHYGGEAQYTYGGGLSGDRPLMPSNIGPSGTLSLNTLFSDPISIIPSKPYITLILTSPDFSSASLQNS